MMKSVILLFSMVVFLVLSTFAQDMQYVSKQSGDTLLVKDDIEFGASNTLYNLMVSDSLAPATRVYELKDGGIYSIVNNPVTSLKYQTIVMGQTSTSVKVNQGAPPPILCGAYATGINSTGGININNDLLIKNCDIEIANSAGSIGWGFFNFNGTHHRIQVDNCIIEHNWWTVIGGPPDSSRIFFTNDYFVNLDGHVCRRNGGVLDFFNRQDTIFVENCTEVHTQGSNWKFRNDNVANKVVFNHNDFINNSGYIFMNIGNQANMSVTNNIFVNSQLQAYAPILAGLDAGETDMDALPMGLVNIRPDSLFDVSGKNFYADNNLVYWDPSLSDIPSTLNANKVNGVTNWVSQMITMNTRTAALFEDKTNYPLLTNGTWITGKLPTFKNTSDLFSTTGDLGVIKAFSLATVDSTYGTPMTSWRQASNPEAANFVYADWPIPIDLSYTDSDLLTAGLGGFPVGDLDWFPTTYVTWKAQESSELALINKTLTNGPQAVETAPTVPQQFQLLQNYPNPFNPSTEISYTIPKSSFVSLKVYNALGQEVATLVNGYKSANTYNVSFDASGLASGIYIYQLRSGSNVMSKKMILMK